MFYYLLLSNIPIEDNTRSMILFFINYLCKITKNVFGKFNFHIF